METLSLKVDDKINQREDETLNNHISTTIRGDILPEPVLQGGAPYLAKLVYKSNNYGL